MDVNTIKTLLKGGVSMEALMQGGASADDIAAAMTGTAIGNNGKSRRIQNTANGGKKAVTVQVIGANDSLPTPVKATKQVVEAPTDAERIVYGDKTIAIHKVRKSFDGENADYVQFTGFRARFGDFTLTMKQARLLADPAIQEALTAYMDKVPQ